MTNRKDNKELRIETNVVIKVYLETNTPRHVLKCDECKETIKRNEEYQFVEVDNEYLGLLENSYHNRCTQYKLGEN